MYDKLKLIVILYSIGPLAVILREKGEKLLFYKKNY